MKTRKVKKKVMRKKCKDHDPSRVIMKDEPKRVNLKEKKKMMKD